MQWFSLGLAGRNVRAHLLLAGLVVTAVLVGWSYAGGAGAAEQGTSCRGSAVRYEAPDQATSEPAVANPSRDPCVTEATSSVRTADAGPFTAVHPRANTNRSSGLITAFAAVDSLSGTPNGVPVTVGEVESSQISACQDGRSVSSGSSRVDNVVVGGAPVPVASGSDPTDTTVPTQGGPVRIRTNQVTTGPEGVTRTALIIDAGQTHMTSGEAIAGGDACLALPAGLGGAGDGSGGRVCPRGSQLDVPTTMCVIHGADGGVVVVGRPYQGPSGGSVITLTEALRRAAAGRLPKSACLRGSGPKYVVIGTKGKDRITGTNRRDRILGLAGVDRIDGGRGDDCLDGGTSRDVLSGALGRDHVIGGQGNDALNGGSGSDRLSGGIGNDTINAAFGRDVVMGGPGRDTINVATSGPRARVDCGSGRDTVRANRNEMHSVRSCERSFFLR
jgi:Ca2+-binding RTX toxin-like protein